MNANWWAAVAAVAAWAAVVVTVVAAAMSRRDARSSDKSAKEAHAAAVQAQHEVTEALRRIADAAEKSRGAWKIEPVSKDRFQARNLTGESAYNAEIEVAPAALFEKDEPQGEISVGATLQFMYVRAWGQGLGRVTIRWTRPNGEAAEFRDTMPA